MFYKVTLWCGVGYTLNKPVVVEAYHEEEALVLASIADENCLFKEANEISVEEEAEMENSGAWVYLDRTEHGHSVGYLLIENAIIEEIGYKVTGYLNKAKKGIMASETFLMIDEAFSDGAWEYMQQGLYVEVRNIETGETWEGDPDNPTGIFDKAGLSI